MKKISVFVLFVAVFFAGCSKKIEKISSLSQLTDKKISVLTGSAGDLAAKAAFPNAKFMNMNSAADAALSVKAGKAAAFIHNKSVLEAILTKERNLELLDDPVAVVSIAAAVKKGNTKLLNEINNVIKYLRENGTLDEMKQKWIESQNHDMQLSSRIENINLSDKLILGTCAMAEPFSFHLNNSITGFDIELALRIGKALNKEIEIADMNFESLIPALQSGKIDVAISNFNVTEERKQFVDFSEAYVQNDISVLVRK